MQPPNDDILTREIALPTQTRVQGGHFINAGTSAYQTLVNDLATALAERDTFAQTCQQQAEQIKALKAKVKELTPKDDEKPAPETGMIEHHIAESTRVPYALPSAEDLVSAKNGAS